MSKNTIVIGVLAAQLMSLVVGVTSVSAAPAGTLTAQCQSNGIYLEWGSHSNANSNGLQKGDAQPGNPDRFWDWLPTNDTQRSYLDTAVVSGQTYSYRVKYRPELPSNVVTIACNFFAATPTPTATVTPGAGTLTAYCASPTRIVLNWTSGVNANSNSIEKGDFYPNDPNRFWEFVLQDQSLTVRSYTDTNVLPGIVYSYRVKYRPELPSNVVNIVCSYATPTPTPYPTYTPYPTATPVPYVALAINQHGRNVTRGQSAEYTSVTARGNDTLDIIIRVRNTSSATAYNVYLTDTLPAGLQYITNSSTLNGRVVADGITSYGLNIGTLYSNQEAMVKISVIVDPAFVPAVGQVVIHNGAHARADGVGTVSSHFPITLNKNLGVGVIGQVNTGPIDSILLALAMSALATGVYAGYTRSGIFGRRLALSEIRQTMTSKSTPNFVR